MERSSSCCALCVVPKPTRTPMHLQLRAFAVLERLLGEYSMRGQGCAASSVVRACARCVCVCVGDGWKSAGNCKRQHNGHASGSEYMLVSTAHRDQPAVDGVATADTGADGGVSANCPSLSLPPEFSHGVGTPSFVHSGAACDRAAVECANGRGRLPAHLRIVAASVEGGRFPSQSPGRT